MLTLQLTLDNRQVTVIANERHSHTFSLHDLNVDLKNFVKDPRPYGIKLFQALFKDGSLARTTFDELSKQSERTIVLVLESSELDGIAWEYAYHDNAYIVEDFAFVRALPEKERPHSNGRLSKSVERVPLLFIPANPLVDLSGEPMRELDIESEWREMTQHIVRSNAPFDLIELRPTTPAALQSVMARFQNGMIAHFSGHGAATKDGAFLLFENENGSSNPLEAREFVREVKDQAWIGFLSACQSAVAERTEYSNLARELVKAGVPFALGMQFNLPDPFAPNISGQFYNYLSQGHAVPEAARQARRAVKRENEFYVGMIALYASHPDEVGKMGWTGSGARTLSTFAKADVSDLPTPSGFIGRQRELMNIGTSLLEKKKPNTVTLHGTGGIGKTALMRQALLRFAPSFELTLAIALDPLPSLESVLGRLERFLNLPSPCSNHTKEREELVHNALTSKRMLLGLDNFETLNYALNEKGSNEEKAAKSLHSFFKSLTTNGVILCITSREVTNLGGEYIEDIYGLTNESGGRLFQDNVVKQKDEIYIKKTQQVSEMLGGHPLALRLLASAFDDQVGTSLDQYIEDLQSFLPKARDKWTEEDRHESLRASFDFTMRNLVKTEKGKELQIALSRLSVFVAFFTDFTAAHVLENNWPDAEEDDKAMHLRADNILHALWKHGLLERFGLPVNEDDYYLYRLHPALYQIASEHVPSEDLATMQENHFRAMNLLANRAYPAGDDVGIYASQFLSTVVLFAMADMLKATKLKQDQETIKLLIRLAFLYTHFGDLEVAMNLCQQSLEISEQLDNLQGKADALLQIAEICVTRGDLDKAMSLYQQSLEIAKGLGSQQLVAAVLHDIAKTCVTRGDLDRAMSLYQQALEIFEELSNPHGKAATLHDMAEVYMRRADFDEAMKLYQQSLEIKAGLGDQQGKAATLTSMAYIDKSRGDFDEAIDFYQQSLDITEKLGDLQGKSATLEQMAEIYAMRGNLDEAMKLYQESLEIFEGLGNLRDKSVTIGDMANIYLIRGDLEKALELQKEKLALVREIGDKREESTALANIGYIYEKYNELDKAINIYQQSLEIKEGLGDLQGKSRVLNNIAVVYVKYGDLDRAMDLCKESLEITEGLSD